MNNKSKTYSIGDVEKMTGVSQRQLRRWEGRYFPEPERLFCGDRAYRRYTIEEVELIGSIKHYQDQGFTLATAAQKAAAENSTIKGEKRYV